MKANNHKSPWMNQPKGMPYAWMPVMPAFGWGMMPPVWPAPQWTHPAGPAPQWTHPAGPMPQWAPCAGPAPQWTPPVWPVPQWTPCAGPAPKWGPPVWPAPQCPDADSEECTPPWMDPEYIKQFFPFIDPESPVGEWLTELGKWLQEMPVKNKPDTAETDDMSDEEESDKEETDKEETDKEEADRKKSSNEFAWSYPPFPPFPFATKKKKQEYRPFSWLTPEKVTAILKIIFDASDEKKDYED